MHDKLYQAFLHCCISNQKLDNWKAWEWDNRKAWEWDNRMAWEWNNWKAWEWDKHWLTSMIAMKERQARKGRTKKGSGDVRSVNHRIPPSFMLSTGTVAILRIPMKKLMKRGTCIAGIRNILPGWQSCFR